ncbi:MAG TPA: hypothetical protein VKI17_12210, partial [Gemmataceae bacterium]|nr:hypothetical protein [Gemmataceae bacterium]
TDELWYQSDLDQTREARGERIPRARIRAISLVPKWKRERLLVAAAADQWEIGPTLTREERTWLTDVLRTWAGPALRAPVLHVPAPPTGSTIQLDRDAEGQPRLAWLPPENVCREARGLIQRRTRLWFAGWIVAEAMLVAYVVAYLLRGRLADVLGCVLWFVLAVAVVSLLACSAAGLAIVTELLNLRRAPRPESVALGRERLRHDPGHYYCEGACSIGPPHNIDRAEISRIELENSVAGRAQLRLYMNPRLRKLRRLRSQNTSPPSTPVAAVVYQQVEVGPCLPADGRTWLAEVLRRWAGLLDAD